MNSLKKINEEIEITEAIRDLSFAYEEISVMKIKQLRDKVLRTRDFYNDLLQVYYIVKTSYKKKVIQLMKKKKIDDYSLLSILVTKKNKRKATIFISANSRLYGDIINKTFNEFLEVIKKQESDVFVIGKVGRRLIDSSDYRGKYLYFDIPDNNVVLKDLKEVVLSLINYQTINVFYGQFETLLKQKAKVSNITGDNPLGFKSVDLEGLEEKKFIFEPSLENVLTFFEMQLFSSLFKQTVEENELARFASRINAMESAIQKIDTKRMFLLQRQKREKRLINNKKQVEQVSRILLKL